MIPVKNILIISGIITSVIIAVAAIIWIKNRRAAVPTTAALPGAITNLQVEYSDF